ncbi:MAG: class I tRNA ligase family protein, partial [Candidatus Binataceae bacterium]
TRRAHKTIKTVTDHIERLRFNTALATLMDQLNYLVRLAPADAGRFAFESYVVMLAPMAPHIAEELWRALGHTASVHLEPWPKFSEELARDEMVTVVVQVNGKVRDRLVVGAGTPEEEVRGMALKSEAVARHLDGKSPKKIIFVPDKLVSIVV